MPGIALIVESDDGVWRCRAMASFAAKNLSALMRLSRTAAAALRPCTFANVNALSRDLYEGARLADELAFREYCGTVRTVDAPDGNACSFFCGERLEHLPQGLVAVSCVSAEPCVAGGVGFLL